MLALCPDSRARKSRKLSSQKSGRYVQAGTNINQIILAEPEQFSGKVHEPLLVMPDCTIAESNRPHSLNQLQALFLTEPLPQLGGIAGKSGLAFVLGFGRRLTIGVQTPTATQVCGHQFAVALRERRVRICELEDQQRRRLPG